LAADRVVKEPIVLSRFGTVNVPITEIYKESATVHEGAWNQGKYTKGVYDSPDVNFDNDDGVIGARIGIRWITRDSPPDKPGSAWWGTIRLYCEHRTDGTGNKWETHVRCDYEKADDYDDSDDVVEEALKELVKENKDSNAKFSVVNGIDAYKIAQKTIDEYINKKAIPKSEVEEALLRKEKEEEEKKEAAKKEREEKEKEKEREEEKKERENIRQEKHAKKVSDDWTKSTARELRNMIEVFFRAKGQRLTNVGTAKKDKLIEIIRKYKINE
jgi:hypothetical protein